MPDQLWTCVGNPPATPPCGASGTTTGTDSGADAKHVKATKHATVSSRCEGVVKRVAGEAA